MVLHAILAIPFPRSTHAYCCERQGQVEIGIIEHEEREFSALGSTVLGRHITGYTKHRSGELVLSTWCGKTMLDCRSEVVERYWSGALAIMYRLTQGRFVVGYALGEGGMLFRGELLVGCDEDEARHQARRIADAFAEIDAD